MSYSFLWQMFFFKVIRGRWAEVTLVLSRWLVLVGVLAGSSKVLVGRQVCYRFGHPQIKIILSNKHFDGFVNTHLFNVPRLIVIPQMHIYQLHHWQTSLYSLMYSHSQNLSIALVNMLFPKTLDCMQFLFSCSYCFIYCFIIMQMAQNSPKQCYLCQATQEVLEYDDEDGICRPCYNEQTQTMLHFKAARTHKYPQIDLIEEGIYLGNEDAATSEQLLKERNITAICACGAHLDTPFSKNPQYVYKVFEIQDFPKQSIIKYFPDHYAWMKRMRQQKRNILIHCAAGVSRSASFTIAYFMKEKGMPLHEAHKFVKSKRKWINPNSGFREQLRAYNKQLGLPEPAEEPEWQQL